MVDLRIVDRDHPAVKEVDSKLIELAKEVSAGKSSPMTPTSIKKVAELQGIDALSINELANSIKPVCPSRRGDQCQDLERRKRKWTRGGLSR